MRAFGHRQNQTQQGDSSKSTGKGYFTPNRDTRSRFDLERAIDHQAVQSIPQEHGSQTAFSATTASSLGHDFSRIPIRASAPELVQLKQAVGGMGDKYEQKADPIKDGVTDKLAEEEPRFGMAGEVGMETKSTAVGESDTTRAETEASTLPQLTKKTVMGPTGGDCGFFKWAIQWELDKNTTKGGLVVQKVEANYDVKDCKGNLYENKTYFDPSWVPFWEAWEIKKGENVTNYPLYDDKFQTPGQLNGTKGEYSTTANAVFYDGIQLSKTNLKVTHKPPAGDLPMSKTDPNLKGGSNSVSHNLKATWDCCSKDKGATKQTKLETD